MSGLDGIVDRAVEYTNKILHTMPSYRQAALAGLRKLHGALAERSPDDPALAKLEAYLESLQPPADLRRDQPLRDAAACDKMDVPPGSGQ